MAAEVILQGLNLLDRKLFLQMAATLSMAAQRMVTLGCPKAETTPYFDMLKVIQLRMRSPGPLLPVHFLKEAGTPSPAMDNKASSAVRHLKSLPVLWCGSRLALRDGHTTTTEVDECTCIDCLKAASKMAFTTSAELGVIVN